jgi:hypothetical protein
MVEAEAGPALADEAAKKICNSLTIPHMGTRFVPRRAGPRLAVNWRFNR